MPFSHPQHAPEDPTLERPASSAAKKREEVLGPLWAAWVTLMTENHPDVLLEPWPVFVASKLVAQLERHGEEVMLKGLTYLVEMWGPISERFTRGKAIVPNASVLANFAGDVLNEARMYFDHRSTLREFNTWKAQNPHRLYPPPALDEAYERARVVLERLGLTLS